MLRFRFLGALVISVALIGGALWFRFVRIPPYINQEVDVSQVESTSSDNDLFLTDFFNTEKTESSSSATSTQKLSESDLIARQLFSDYAALKARGKTTPGDINTLADKYAESIKNIEISIPKINLNQVILLPDSEVNLATYGNNMTNIRNKYKNLVTSQTENSGGDITNTNSKAFFIFMNEVGKLYQAAASELLLIGVPLSLASNHMNIINHYFENAEIMKLISNTNKDPLRAYAAINIYAKSSEREAELLSNIQKTLISYGIIFNSGI